MQQDWDVTADVVTAHDLGASVIILEKAPEGEEGGNTRVAGQGYLNTSSVESAIAYLTALCGPFTVPEAMVQVWAEERRYSHVRRVREQSGDDPQLSPGRAVLLHVGQPV